MANNFLNYANLSYDEIVSQVTDKLQADPKFANFRESSIAQMMIEIFAATAELMSHTIERRAEESFFDTAQLRSSVIALSRQLGYSVQRPIPAQAKINVVLKGNLATATTITAGDVIQIPLQSSFSYSNLTFFLKSMFSVQITQQMKDDMAQQGANYTKTFTVDYKGSDVTIVEGQIKEKIFNGNTNVLVGQKFQSYKIDDTTFSNIYGEDDFDSPITRVWVGPTKEFDNSNEFSIDKKSLLNFETINNLTSASQICLIRSSNNEGIDLMFGDGGFATNGAKTKSDNIYIQYLSTKGSKGNQTGLIGEILSYSGNIVLNTKPITEFFTFTFATNSIGGADMESIDSIRVNAPAIYYSLDRLVTIQDYVNYLKSLSSPIVVKNALAWGEQEERKQQHLDAIKKMFNIVLFSCIGSMYDTDLSPYFPKEQGKGIDDVVLDANFDEDGISIRSYLNVYVMETIVDQLKDYQSTAMYNRIFGKTTPAFASPTALNTFVATTPKDLFLEYKSDTYDTTVTGTTSVSIDLSTAISSTYPTLTKQMNAVANLITTQLQTITDTRGLASINTNFNQPAFPSVSCYYNEGGNLLEVSGASTNSCYINSFYGDFANELGLSGMSSDKLIGTYTEPLAEGIIQIINNIKKRSQVTVDTVYVSPIIEKFKLSGTVYVDSLYDLIVVQNQVNDAIYSFLDVNADFNTSVYISNITRLVESIAGIKYADISFVPEYPTPIGASFLADVKPIITGWETFYGTTTDYIYNIISATNFDPTLATERYFYDRIKILYNQLITYPNLFNAFAVSNDFITVVSALHKDNVQYIRQNLINTNGDIGQEIIQLDGVTPKYGYTLGSEIPRLKSVLNFSYKV